MALLIYGVGTVMRASTDKVYAISVGVGNKMVVKNHAYGSYYIAEILDGPNKGTELYLPYDDPEAAYHLYEAPLGVEITERKYANTHGLKNGDIFTLKPKRSWYKKPSDVFLFLGGGYYNLSNKQMRATSRPGFGHRYEPQVITSLAGTAASIMAAVATATPKDT